MKSVLEVRHNGALWVLRPHGSSFPLHSAATKAEMESFVEDHMLHRSGKVVFFSATGDEEETRQFGGDTFAA